MYTVDGGGFAICMIRNLTGSEYSLVPYTDTFPLPGYRTSIPLRTESQLTLVAASMGYADEPPACSGSRLALQGIIDALGIDVLFAYTTCTGCYDAAGLSMIIMGRYSGKDS